jgi:hypothetical protein
VAAPAAGFRGGGGGPDGVPVEALVVRLDRVTGVAEVKSVVALDAAFDAFKAALLLWHAGQAAMLETVEVVRPQSHGP